MMTPIEIQNKEFKKSFGSYKASEVDDFIEKVYSEFDRLYRENTELKGKLTVYTEKVESYVAIEKTLQNTLIIAQSTSEDVIQNARKRAETIIKEGEMHAEAIISKGNKKLTDLNAEYEKNLKLCRVFKSRFKTFIENELENIKDLDQILAESKNIIEVEEI